METLKDKSAVTSDPGQATSSPPSAPAGPKKKSAASSALAQIKEIENNPYLQELCSKLLPSNYNFEIPKTIWRIRRIPNCSLVALQMPEGLLLFATKIAEILRQMTGADCLLMGDVTYGACCVDDFTASMLGAKLLVHYGHSCLVPTSVANLIDTMYIFVTIHFDTEHTIQAIQQLLEERSSPNRTCDKTGKRLIKIRESSEGGEGDNDEKYVNKPSITISLVSTIQFALSLNLIKQVLEETNNHYIAQVTIPRSKPLSQGEILGCTAPKVTDDLIIYIGDGRFHLEAMMMANPSIEAFKYDPYNKILTKEGFDHEAQKKCRHDSIKSIFKNGSKNKKITIGLIQGTLGRQGNSKPVEYMFDTLHEQYNCFVVLMSEVLPAKLNLFQNVDAWVQFACPRLSIDWGSAFNVPLLTPYEAIWGLTKNEKVVHSNYETHPMDYYAYNSLGPHTPNYIAT